VDRTGVHRRASRRRYFEAYDTRPPQSRARSSPTPRICARSVSSIVSERIGGRGRTAPAHTRPFRTAHARFHGRTSHRVAAGGLVVGARPAGHRYGHDGFLYARKRRPVPATVPALWLVSNTCRSKNADPQRRTPAAHGRDGVARSFGPVRIWSQRMPGITHGAVHKRNSRE